MSRYFFIWLFALTVIGVLFFYKTPSVPPVLEEQAGEFGGVSLSIDYATTPEARERGLGGRTEIDKDYGMLFVFPKDDYYGFWMKDTLVPLDIFWLNSDGHVVSVIKDIATSSYPNVFYPSSPARYVLETVSGFANEHNIATGTPLMLKNFPNVSE